MKRYFFSLILLTVHCTLLTPEHQFTDRLRISFAPGSGAGDTAAVLVILAANNLPDTLFSSVTEVGEDLRICGLFLHGKGIDTLPPVIGEMAALGRLDLSGNRLSTLPGAITQLCICLDFIERGWQPIDYDSRVSLASRNGLAIHNNSLCSLPDSVEKWLNWHFGTDDYLMIDTTQQCGER